MQAAYLYNLLRGTELENKHLRFITQMYKSYQHQIVGFPPKDSVFLYIYIYIYIYIYEL